jgi:hypothetical protein
MFRHDSGLQPRAVISAYLLVTRRGTINTSPRRGEEQPGLATGK